jgi:lipoprotein signal peptidase
MEKQANKILTSLKKGILFFFEKGLWCMPVLLAVDILTKLLINKYVGPGTSVTIIPNFCYISVIYNPASGYGSLGNLPSWGHVLIRFVALVAMSFYLIKSFKKLNGWYKAALYMLIPGDVGNLIDHFGHWVSPGNGPYGEGVIDWLEFKSNIKIFSYTCNFADVLLTFGAIALVVGLILEDFINRKQEEKNQDVIKATMNQNGASEAPAEDVKSEKEEKKESASPEEKKSDDEKADKPSNEDKK